MAVGAHHDQVRADTFGVCLQRPFHVAADDLRPPAPFAKNLGRPADRVAIPVAVRADQDQMHLDAPKQRGRPDKPDGLAGALTAVEGDQCPLDRLEGAAGGGAGRRRAP